MIQNNTKKYYWYGFLTIFPVIGVIIGIVLFRKGIKLKDRILLILGLFGMLFTFALFFGGLFYSQYSDTGKAQREELARSSINEVMRDIEIYKIQFGQYPDSLQELKFVDNFVFINDPLSQKGMFSRKLSLLHYQKVDSKHYTLFSAGLDRIPYTSDDVYPFIPGTDSSKFGFIKVTR